MGSNLWKAMMQTQSERRSQILKPTRCNFCEKGKLFPTFIVLIKLFSLHKSVKSLQDFHNITDHVQTRKGHTPCWIKETHAMNFIAT